MSAFAFATCDRKRALSFLKKLYPSTGVADTGDSAGPLLDLVEQDIVRICDPDFHGGQGVIAGQNYQDSHRAEAYQVAKEFHERCRQEL